MPASEIKKPASVATGGALAVAIAVTALGAATGGGLGGLLAHAIGRKHQKSVSDQVGSGGLVVWVTTPDDAARKRATDTMTKLGLKDVHAHEIELTDPAPVMIEPDPFLERDPGCSIIPPGGHHLAEKDDANTIT